MRCITSQQNILKFLSSHTENFYPLIYVQISYFMTCIIHQKLFLNKELGRLGFQVIRKSSDFIFSILANLFLKIRWLLPLQTKMHM